MADAFVIFNGSTYDVSTQLNNEISSAFTNASIYGTTSVNLTIDSGATVTTYNTGWNINSASVLDSGYLTLNFYASVADSGNIIAEEGGIVDIEGYTTTARGDLQFGTSDGGSTIGSGGTFILGAGGSTSIFSQITNIQAGDAYYFSGIYADGYTTSAGGGITTFHLTSGGSAIDVSFQPYLTGSDVASFEVIQNSNGTYFLAICFLPGTRIATAKGEVAIETLSAGDLVATVEHGATVLRPVKWVGHRRIDIAAHPRPELAAAIRIRAGAFAEAIPKRDLLVSPDHCLFVDDKLVPAKLLINGGTIVQETGRRSITYYHVELDRHAVLLAEGLPVESYLDTGNRAFFANAGMALMLHPEFHVNAGLKCWEQDACAPLAVGQEAVLPIWTRLAERAAMLGFTCPGIATTSDADLHLIAGARTIRAASVDGARHVFVLPRGTDFVTIASRIGFATDTVPYSNDWRRLGVAVTRIFVSCGADRIEVPVDHPMLTRGWHKPEQTGAQMWRWTEGAATLPIPATDMGIVTVELALRGGMTYRVEEAARIAA